MELVTRKQEGAHSQYAPSENGWRYISATTFAELLTAVEGDEREKIDVRVKRKDLRLDANLCIDGVPLTDHALRQFAIAAKTPRGVLTLRRIGQEARLAELLNERMARIGLGDDTCLIRLRSNPEDGRVVRAVFSRVPVFFDTRKVLEILADAVGEDIATAALPRVQTDGNGYSVKVILPDSVETVHSTAYVRGLALSISEVGLATILSAYVFDPLNRTGMVEARDKFHLQPAFHNGEVDDTATVKSMKQAIDVACSASKGLVAQIDYAHEISVAEPEALLAYLAKQYRLTQEEANFWVTGFCEVGAVGLPVSAGRAYFVLNGLIRGAKGFADSARRDRLEGLASAILAPSSKSSREEMRGHWECLARKTSKLKLDGNQKTDSRGSTLTTRETHRQAHP